MKKKRDIRHEIASLAKATAGVLRVLEARGESRIPGHLPRVTERPRPPEPGTGELAAPPMDMGKEARLEHLRQQAEVCKRCPLARERTKVVFGQGSNRARVVFIGEGPGAREDATGEVFVGRAGQLLTRMLAAIGIDREDVYITNIVKCRPPRNRDPEPDEVAACRPFLEAQLKALEPEIVVSLGRPSAQSLLNETRPLGQLRKRIHPFKGIDLLVTYHPAFLLRNPARKAAAWQDLLLLLDVMVRKKLRPPLPAPWWRA